MKGWTMSDKALCPFYRGETMQRIRCEGAETGSSIQLVFGDAAERKRYEARHCKSWRYEKCIVCGALEKKYGE